ncbi:prephenate dehydrogenase dimerization domain-containing protein [Streptomyces coeruleorubidus]|uniref:prephenate dehydrogenase dimerization domain-containing protein n=1 Tax=Streptomyces coeruleorubidus TaxID=116188 RepID=UPI0033A98D67
MAARLVDSPNDVARLAGQELRDTIRIANGAPGLWSDILRSHAVPLARVMAEFREDLAEAVAALDTQESSPGRDPGQHVGVVSDLLSTGAAGWADTQPRRNSPLTACPAQAGGPSERSPHWVAS